MGDVRVTVFDDTGDEMAAWTTTPEGEHVVDEPLVIDAAHIQRQIDFSLETFGPGSRLNGVLDHIRKELAEVEEDPEGDEWVDVIILAIDGAWRNGWEAQPLIDAIIAKQTKNEKRTWPDWRTADPNKAIEHDRTPDLNRFDVV